MQANIYRDAKKFVSFKKTISEMGSNYSHIPMFSLQSISKGYYGEHQHSRGSLLNLQASAQHGHMAPCMTLRISILSLSAQTIDVCCTVPAVCD